MSQCDSKSGWALGALLFALVLVVAGCVTANEPGEPPNPDALPSDAFSAIDVPKKDTTPIYSNDTFGTPDTQTPPTDTATGTDWVAADTQPNTGSASLCEGPCTSDAMCGATADLCLRNSLTNETFCGQDCRSAACPTGFACADLGEGRLQCVPQSGDCSAPAGATGLGLCEGPCASHDSCGGPMDYCLTNGDTSESFCSQACGTGCPTGYACADLGGGITQCVPSSGSCSGTTPPPTCVPACAAGQTCSNGVCVTAGDYEAELQHCVDLINDYRAQHGRSALIRDASIETCAANGAASDSVSGVAHEYFQNTSGCGFTATSENEIPGWPLSSYGSINTIIDQGTAQMMAEGPGGGHYENILRTSSTRVGCGIFVTSGGAVWVVQDFR